MHDEPLPHQRLPGSTEEWQYDTVNNPKAVSRSRAAEQWERNETADSYAGGAGVLGIFVMPFIMAILYVGLLFLPFFWIGFFAAGAGWSFSLVSQAVAIPVALWASLILLRKFSRAHYSVPRDSGRRPYEHVSFIRRLFRAVRRAIAKGRPASLGDSLTIGFAAIFCWLILTSHQGSRERVGPTVEGQQPWLVPVVHIANLPVWMVKQVEKVAPNLGRLKEISVPLFVTAVNALFYAIPISVILWPLLRISQYMARR